MTESKALVTVLMSVYNGAPYLSEAIESILNQSYSDLEFLIIDDGSTDETWSLLSGYRDPRIRLVQNRTNIGLTRSLNLGLLQAHGEYVARMDADDIAYKDRLISQLEVLEKNKNFGMVCSAFDVINASGKYQGTQVPAADPQKLMNTLLYTNPICHPTATIRSSVLRNVGGYDDNYPFAQDYDLWLRISERYSIYAIQRSLIRIRIHAKSYATGRMRIQQRYYANLAQIAAFKRREIESIPEDVKALHFFTRALYETSSGNDEIIYDLFELAFGGINDEGDLLNKFTHMAVNLAVELGPSGRRLILNNSDIKSAEQFLKRVITHIPKQYKVKMRAEIMAEFHAACAFLLLGDKQVGAAAKQIFRSWLIGPRHRRNFGIIKKLASSFHQ